MLLSVIRTHRNARHKSRARRCLLAGIKNREERRRFDIKEVRTSGSVGRCICVGLFLGLISFRAGITSTSRGVREEEEEEEGIDDPVVNNDDVIGEEDEEEDVATLRKRRFRANGIN